MKDIRRLLIFLLVLSVLITISCAGQFVYNDARAETAVSTGTIGTVNEIELVYKRTANSRTYQLADGTKKCEIYAADVFQLNDLGIYEEIISPLDSGTVSGATTTYDTYISSKYPTKNYYTNSYLRTGKDEDFYVRRAYIKFTLPTDIIATNVFRAEFQLEKYSGSAPTIRAYKVTQDWSSSELTWNTAPTHYATGTNIATNATGNWYSIDVTDYATSWLTNPSTNRGMVLIDDTEDDINHWTTFYASDASSSHRPKLTIYYMDIDSISSNIEGFYLPGRTYNFSITLNGATTASTVKVAYPYATDGTMVAKESTIHGETYFEAYAGRKTLLTLSRSGTTNTYTGSYTFSLDDFRNQAFYGNMMGWRPRHFAIEVTQGADTIAYANPDSAAYVTYLEYNAYAEQDTTFYYNSPTDNSFVSFATVWYRDMYIEDKITTWYNCLGYVIGDFDEEVWWWEGNSSPSKTEVDTEMAARGYTVLSSAKDCDIIYYDGGHFALVDAYDNNGFPSSIVSKWGQWEVIRSQGYDPFDPDHSPYGSPVGFYKKNS